MNPSSEYGWEKYSSSSEKHISVDPISLRQEISPPRHDDHPKTPNKLMMFSCSSFPKSPAKQKQKKLSSKNSNEGLCRQNSVALTNLERLRESQLQRSKSCGERRACQPSIDFDLCSSSSSSITTATPKDVFQMSHKKGRGSEDDARPSVSYKYNEEKFKCCLFLPGFGKPPKTVRAAIKEDEDEDEGLNIIGIVSQRVSLEKFECGSWRSSAIINSEDQDGDATSNLFFDLPVELIRCSTVNDTESPVTTAFLFDNKDYDHQPKGVLKNTQPRKSQDSSSTSTSSRHVRFSNSSPTSPQDSSSCITPRLRKARDEFNAFLEAQSA